MCLDISLLAEKDQKIMVNLYNRFIINAPKENRIMYFANILVRVSQFDNHSFELFIQELEKLKHDNEYINISLMIDKTVAIIKEIREN